MGYGDWGGWEGYYTGYYPAARGGSQVQRSGPRNALQGMEWVVPGSRTSLHAQVRTRTPDHPLRPQGPPGPASLSGVLLAGKGRDSGTFPGKLVKTTKCHQKSTKRPAIVPIFQNGLQKSPLDFPRFPYLAAFSHKELMGLF